MPERGLIERYRDRLNLEPGDPIVSLQEGSTPLILAGALLATTSSVKAPLPQPTSTHFRPGSGASHCRKTSPANRLQTPIIRS